MGQCPERLILSNRASGGNRCAGTVWVPSHPLTIPMRRVRLTCGPFPSKYADQD